MSAKIDYYFTSISPFTYLGHSKLLEITQEKGVKAHYKPVRLGQVFSHSGALPLPERPQCRQAYRLLELERWAKKRNLPITLKPAYFPADPGLADRCIIALQQEGQTPDEFLKQALAACWAQEQNIADEATIRGLLQNLGFDSSAIIKRAQSDEVIAEYDQNTADAIEQGVLGAPAYLLNGEQFWGQDRLELLAETLG